MVVERLLILKINLAPFVDLFSILAVGLLVIMSVSSGTDQPIQDRPNYTIVRFYLGLPEAIQTVSGPVAMDNLAMVSPFFLRNCQEVSRYDIGVTVDISRSPNYMEIMLQGEPSQLAVGFRVSEIIDPAVIGMTFDSSILFLGGESAEPIETTNVMGHWREPIVDIAGASCGCGRVC